MQTKCPAVWSKYKTQRQDRIQNWNTKDIFNEQLRISSGNASASHLLQDFFVARVPSAYYLIHKKGIDKTPRISTATCKIYAMVNNHPEAGLGHRMSNFLQGALIAETFELEQIIENVDIGIETSVHGAYEGMTEFLGIIQPTDATRGAIKNCTLKTYPQIRYESGIRP
jgi:hypothetical protein